MFEVPPSGPIPADVMIVGEAPGETEVRQMRPFCGASGALLDELLLGAKLPRSLCFLTNVCRIRPPNNKIEAFIHTKKTKIPPTFLPLNGWWVDPAVQSGVEKLHAEIAVVKPKVIIALGNTALWALTNKTGIGSWRGSFLEHQSGAIIVPTYHPAAILRVFSWRATAQHDFNKAAAVLTKGRDVRQYSFTTRPTYDQTLSYLQSLSSRAERESYWLSVDIETRAHSHIACVGFSTSPTEAFCIPLMCVEKPDGYFSPEEEYTLTLEIKRILTHPNVKVVGQNFLYDAQYFFFSYGFIPNLKWDTMGAQHTLFPGTPKDLGYLSSVWCNDHTYWKDEGKEWDVKTGEDQLWEYNCKDAARTFEIMEAQRAAIERANLQSVNTFQIEKLWRMCLEMMIRGVRYDTSRRTLLESQLAASLVETHQRIEYILGHPFNPRSGNQMQTLFYVDFAEPIIRHPKTKTPTLDDNALQTIARRNPILTPLINLISDYRSLNVFKSTFIDASPGFDLRMRCSINPYGPYTFRFATSKDAFGSGMNLQNLPTEGSKSLNKAAKRGSASLFPDVRKSFIPDPGKYFWNADLDRADLQVVVWEADDAELKQMLREGVDLHKENAKVLFNLTSVSQVTKAQREFAKSFVHGTNYGGSARTMAIATGSTIHQAERAQHLWFSAHPGIKEWHRRTEAALQTTRSVTNRFGYRCVFFDRVEGLLPEALAWIPQSTVACSINRSMAQIVDTFTPEEVEVLLQVHDSTAGQADFSIPPEAIVKAALVTIPYADPLTIPLSIKTSTESWGACV